MPTLLQFLPDTRKETSFISNRNGQPRGAPIPGADFYSAVMRIWLGDKPVDDGLKKGLLGG